MATEHVLKTWPMFFDAIKSGEKTFEVRRAHDRLFREGDTLVLERTDENKIDCYVPRHHHERGMPARDVIRKRVTFVLHGGQFGIEPGYVVMGLADVPASPPPGARP